ncbi:MAG: hypothetical protein QOI25_656 [Mycobacterium sp.]|nr:hypothetical protein [Mycobacterium sp.]
MKSPPASKYGYVSAVTSGAEVTDGMNFFYLGTDFSILSFETNPETDTNAPAMLWFPKGDQWHESGYIGGNAVWSGDYYPISESAVTRFQQHCRDRFAGFKARSAGLPDVTISPDNPAQPARHRARGLRPHH